MYFKSAALTCLLLLLIKSDWKVLLFVSFKRQQQQQQKRTRIMLISLMMSKMFHLLSARLFFVLWGRDGWGANKIIQLINSQLLTTINKALYDEDKTFALLHSLQLQRVFCGHEKGILKQL